VWVCWQQPEYLHLCLLFWPNVNVIEIPLEEWQQSFSFSNWDIICSKCIDDIGQYQNISGNIWCKVDRNRNPQERTNVALSNGNLDWPIWKSKFPGTVYILVMWFLLPLLFATYMYNMTDDNYHCCLPHTCIIWLMTSNLSTLSSEVEKN
jgi:hypothetical protein